MVLTATTSERFEIIIGLNVDRRNMDLIIMWARATWVAGLGETAMGRLAISPHEAGICEVV
jgi:hypothetical protein